MMADAEPVWSPSLTWRVEARGTSVLKASSQFPSSNKHAGVVEPMELKPVRPSAKRQKMMDKIKSSGSEAKRFAEVVDPVQEALTLLVLM